MNKWKRAEFNYRCYDCDRVIPIGETYLERTEVGRIEKLCQWHGKEFIEASKVSKYTRFD